MFYNGFSGLPLVYSGRLNPTERGMFCLTFRQVIGAILKNFLKKCKGVSSFRLGRYGEGETGVTVVDLK